MNILDSKKKIDVLLTQPPHKQDENIPYFGKEIPLGIAYLAAYLEKQGITTEIFDMNVCYNPFQLYIKILDNLNPSFVGISAFTIDIIKANEIAKLTKNSNKDIVTIIGGVHATALPKETLEEFNYFDYLIYGRGEVTLTELVNKLKSKEDVSSLEGLAYREGNTVKINAPRKKIISLDELPFPAREKLELVRYKPHKQKYKRLPNTGIISSIGCPYHCSYCSVKIVHPQIFFRSAKKVVEEIKDCVRKFGIRDFRFYDDCFSFDRKRIVEFCRLIVDESLDISWNCVSRVDCVDFELLKLMKEAGCYLISYGIDGGTDRSLKIINKRTTLDQARNAIKVTKRAGIESSTSFLIGIPGQTIGEMNATIRFAKELSPDLANFYILKAYPGTKIYDEAKINGKLQNKHWDKYFMQGPPVVEIGISDEEIMRLLKKAYYSFYFRPRYIWQRIKRILKSPIREFAVAWDGAKMVSGYFKKRTKKLSS
ncbi:MAG: B12-binding domain-containing radical SAM protein [Candidatus Omnitrophica bacterium]|nr:B12-binding domain-containing radical SAM protein [bacterium]MBU1134810.1 B12-binding domain-containing radical SAM protein [Candidatus Omnitrophota bacterium]MBU1811391.1 B12-binding domain-containing radical SAM protein [Candidatus Omnitrophota bacterium]